MFGLLSSIEAEKSVTGRGWCSSVGLDDVELIGDGVDGLLMVYREMLLNDMRSRSIEKSYLLDSL